MKLYSIRDRLAQEFAPIFEAKNDEVADRVVRQLMAKSPGLNLSDFELYRLGSFSYTDGFLDPEINPILVSSEYASLGKGENNG